MRTARLLSKRWLLLGIPWLILGIGLTLTWLLAARLQRDEQAHNQSEFQVRTSEVLAGIERRLEANGQLLRGVVGLFASSDDVSRQEFRQYVSRLQLSEFFPGIQAIGFAQIASAQDIDRHIALIRAQDMQDRGLLPEEKSSSHSTVRYIEPQDERNRRVLGDDLLTDPARWEAALKARDTGLAIMTGKTSLVQDTNGRNAWGTLIFMPVYRQGIPLQTPEQRQSALLGWTYIALQIDKLIENYLNAEYAELRKRIALQLYDGSQPSPEHLFFASPPAGAPSHPAHEARYSFTVHDRTWTLQISSLPDYLENEPANRGRTIVIVTGALLSAMLALASLILTRSHAHVVAALHSADVAHRELAEQQALLRAVYDSSSVAICLVDIDGEILHANQRMAKIFRCPLDTLIGRRFTEFLPEDAHEGLRERLTQLLQGQTDIFHADRIFLHSDGSKFWGRANGRLVKDSRQRTIGIVVVVEDITKRRQAEARVHHLAHHDYLTGLPNRALFVEHATQALELAKRHQRRLAILFIDLDRFKPINDQYGHAAGDTVLKAIAERLHGMLRTSDTICRQGGDEFVILLPEFDEPAHIEKLARNLREAIQQPCSVDGKQLSVSAAIGIACYPEHGSSVDELVRQADSAMYQAKTDPARPIRFATDIPAHGAA